MILEAKKLLDIVNFRVHMLGEIIYEATGLIKNQRVINADKQKIETTFEARGKIKDIEVLDVGTFWSVPRQDGSIYGENKSVFFTSDNDVIATAEDQVIGQNIDTTTLRFIGSAFFKTSYDGRLSSLNNIIGVFEAEVKDNKHLTVKKWEWK